MKAGLSIKLRVMLTLGGIFLCTTVLVGFFAYQYQMSQLKNDLHHQLKYENDLFHSMIQADIEGLARAQVGLTRIDGMLQLFAEKKRDELLDMALPIFNDLLAGRITHMYFIEPDGTVFLRVHKPGQSGDRLDRATFRQARDGQQLVAGIEMGKNFFSLRSIQPISYQGEPVGYFEIAQEIDHNFQLLKTITGNDITILLANDFLRNSSAELKNDEVGEFTLLYSSEKNLSLQLAGKSVAALQKGFLDFHTEVVALGGEKYAVGISPLKDVAGNAAGIIMSRKNITGSFEAIWRGIALVLFAQAIILLLLAVVISYLSLRKSFALFEQIRNYVLSVTTDWDLTRRIDVNCRDEIGGLGTDINRMTEQLAEMVTRVHSLSGELDNVSTDLKGVSKQMVLSAELQAKDIGTTVSAITEIDASIREVAIGVDGLAVSSAETSSSITEMASCIEEAAINTENLANSVEEVTSSITEMISSIRQVGENAGELLDASGTMASSVAQMNVTIHQVEKNAAGSSRIAGQVLADAERGKSCVDATVEGMRQIRDSSGVTTQVVRSLSDKVENIGSILSLIDEVAEQTNLLALNAAIIAAQAGDQGRGFAVVAEEIKELADRSKVSIRQIDSVIKGIEDETRRAVDVIRQSEKVIEEGERLSLQSGEALVGIVTGVKDSASQIEEIARAMREQAGGSQMIRKATEKVAEMIAQIVQGNREQEKGGELIMRAADRMRELTAQVRSSSQEQSLGGRQISLATENVMERVGQIKVATCEQRSGSGQIIQAAESIRLSADKSLSAVKVLDQTLERLTAQVGSLREEIDRFRI